VEIVEPHGAGRARRPACRRPADLPHQAERLRRGLIVELGGRHGAVARFLPPLTVTAEQIDQIASDRGDGLHRRLLSSSRVASRRDFGEE
jgi:diaminobutyrate-2-oxoglutarate transaminase